jgi:hypothetical protein
MKTGFVKKYSCVFALNLVCAVQLQAQAVKLDPVATTKALSALLAVANTEIPQNSSCQGDYGQTGRARVRDLLSVQFAYLYAGENVVLGECTNQKCVVSISHAAGESVSSATIKFSISGGKARVTTLWCALTP